VWFAFAFEGKDSEVDLEAHGHVEFDAWRWADIDEALDAIIPFKRDVYAQVVAAFRPLAAKVREGAL
jgi:putative (di)nucleoside polyphosphate hydrolase